MITGTYHYRQSDYMGGFTSYKLKVEILDETDKSYRIRYLEPGAFGTPVGTKKWVRKGSVHINGVNNKCLPVDLEIKLPYKD